MRKHGTEQTIPLLTNNSIFLYSTYLLTDPEHQFIHPAAIYPHGVCEGNVNCEMAKTSTAGMEFAILEDDSGGSVAVVASWQEGANIVIPGGVTVEGSEHPVRNLGPAAFCESRVEQVTIPDTVRKFGKKCFSRTGQLETVTMIAGCLPARIPAKCFNKSSLTGIEIPTSVKSIGRKAFNKTNHMVAVIFAEPFHVTHFKEFAFFHAGIESFTIPNSVTTVGPGCFSRCLSLREFIIAVDSPLTDFADDMFSYSGLRSLDCPRGLLRFGKRCFLGCDSLSEVIIHKLCRMTHIDDEAFKGCPITKLIIVPTIKWIGTHALPKGCNPIFAKGQRLGIYTAWRTEWRIDQSFTFGQRPDGSPTDVAEKNDEKEKGAGGCCIVV
jgi:hypothetical protein